MALKQHLRELQGNPLGLAILVVGVLAVLIVGGLAYQTLGGSSDVDQQITEVSQEEIQSLKQPVFQEQQSLRAQEEKKQSFKRQKAISENKIIGAWDAQLDKARALLQLKGGTYRLIIVMNNPSESRWFSNGTYTLKDDLLLLVPNMAWGAPKSSKFGYRVLTRGDMPVMVSTYKGKLVWQIPDDDVDVYVPNYHPVLSLVKDKIAVWSVLK